MTQPFQLRPARSTDAGKLGAMMSEAVAGFDWKPMLHSGAEDIAHAGKLIDRGWVTVAAQDRTLLGFIARDDEYVHALHVAANAQGGGVGKALIDHAKAQCRRLELWTFAANTGAQRFYEREGFAVLERTDGASNEEGLPDIRYRWPAPLTLKDAAHD
ncbi:GNAT family N-acetyltransferase [Tropicibacter oceani]|uniref:GNAT family N-acetyltransferase n=1 Tax=Tropicibacter oceani TaxID=3058420 RepID=A0ABY8QGE0_9RHOB|nr:GNAT family N-acetyltransferase [Tropicibacter oceani]WGW03689.1 GNAT family N-acetyltransferase [Tropicibacter oceani]